MLDLQMFQQDSSAISAILALMTLMCLGLLAYCGLHRKPARITELARKRPQLLSVGAGIAFVLGVLQLHQSWQKNNDAAIAGGFMEVANPSTFAGSGGGQTGEALSNPTAVATYHNDNARTGQYTDETVLTTDNVNAAHFGKLYSFPVDGYVYAQPLYIPQLPIPASGVHNVVVVATQHDSVYAFDADSSSPTPLWRVNFLNADAGVTTVVPADVNASDIVPEIGITGTPVIDTSSNTLYVVAATKEKGAFFHRLHALDLASGAEKFGGPRTIQATYPGMARESSGGMLTFASRFQLQRAGLLLSKGMLYVAFASYGDLGPYHGWVFAYEATTLKQAASWVSTPNGYQGGIWMSGCGIAADDQGNLYLSTSNGEFDVFGASPGLNFGDSIVKLTAGASGLAVTDFFTPFDQRLMATEDLDLGSAGIVLLPDQPKPYPHLAVTADKRGHIYVVNRDRLGGYNVGGQQNPQLVQEIVGQLREQLGTPAYWNGYLYFGSGVSPFKDSIRAFKLRNGRISNSSISQTQAIYQLTRSTVSVSANGNSNGIVWVVQTDGYYNPGQAGPAVLRAYDATDLAHELYNSNRHFARDNPGPASKFTVPAIANGKVFVGTANQLSVYGLLSPRTGN